MIRRAAIIGLMVGLTLGGLTSCAVSRQPTPVTPTSPTPTAPDLPPRQSTLPLTNLKPCELITPDQAIELKIDDVTPSSNNDGLGSAQCLWSTFPEPGKPDNGWVIRLNLKEGAELGLNPDDPLVKVVQVDGFPAVQTYPQGSDGRTDCIEAIDVAPHQSMQVFYTNLAGDYPGIDHQVACQLADKVARMAMGNLRRLAG